MRLLPLQRCAGALQEVLWAAYLLKAPAKLLLADRF